MNITTTVGPATVLHRLALGVQPLDAVTEDACAVPLRVGREVPRRPGQRGDPMWPTVDLDARGTSRFVLCHGRGVGAEVTLRLGDAGRRVVPRRFRIPLWTLAEVAAAETAGGLVPARSRMLRPWLSPGTAAVLPLGTSGVRGHVTERSTGRVVRWPRITAFGRWPRVTPPMPWVPVGWAHGDDRGEFLLPVVRTPTDTLPASADESVIDVRLILAARVPAPDPEPDPWADLPVERVRRSQNPPVPFDLDNALLRGRFPPPGYRFSRSPRPALDLPVGEVVDVGDLPYTA